MCPKMTTDRSWFWRHWINRQICDLQGVNENCRHRFQSPDTKETPSELWDNHLRLQQQIWTCSYSEPKKTRKNRIRKKQLWGVQVPDMITIGDAAGERNVPSKSLATDDLLHKLRLAFSVHIDVLAVAAFGYLSCEDLLHISSSLGAIANSCSKCSSSISLLCLSLSAVKNSTRTLCYVLGSGFSKHVLNSSKIRTSAGRPDSWRKTHYYAEGGCQKSNSMVGVVFATAVFPNPEVQASMVGRERTGEQDKETKSTCSSGMAAEWWWMLESFEWIVALSLSVGRDSLGNKANIVGETDQLYVSQSA